MSYYDEGGLPSNKNTALKIIRHFFEVQRFFTASHMEAAMNGGERHGQPPIAIRPPISQGVGAMGQGTMAISLLVSFIRRGFSHSDAPL